MALTPRVRAEQGLVHLHEFTTLSRSRTGWAGFCSDSRPSSWRPRFQDTIHLPAVAVFTTGALFALVRLRIEASARDSAVIYHLGMGPYSFIKLNRRATFEAVDVDAQYQRAVSYPVYLRWASAGGRRHRSRLLTEVFDTAKVAVDLAQAIHVPVGVSPGFLTYASSETRKALSDHAVIQFQNRRDTVPLSLLEQEPEPDREC